MNQSDILLDVFQYLELNEVEKSEYVSNLWRKVIRNSIGKTLRQKRRLRSFKITNVMYCFYLNNTLSTFIFSSI